MAISGPREAHIDYAPVSFRNEFDLQPGMAVRPCSATGQVMDDRSWKVERVSGAFTRCIAGNAENGGKGAFTSQYWATDSLRPVHLFAPATPANDPAQEGTPGPVRRAGAREPDAVAAALAQCQGLDAMLAYAESLGYKDCVTLRSRVSHLNPGLQRMNVGNRLRRFLGVT